VVLAPLDRGPSNPDDRNNADRLVEHGLLEPRQHHDEAWRWVLDEPVERQLDDDRAHSPAQAHRRHAQLLPPSRRVNTWADGWHTTGWGQSLMFLGGNRVIASALGAASAGYLQVPALLATSNACVQFGGMSATVLPADVGVSAYRPQSRSRTQQADHVSRDCVRCSNTLRTHACVAREDCAVCTWDVLCTRGSRTQAMQLTGGSRSRAMLWRRLPN
jgi:hypothetical protein